MTVQQLIDALSKHNPELVVSIEMPNEPNATIERIEYTETSDGEVLVTIVTKHA